MRVTRFGAKDQGDDMVMFKRGDLLRMILQHWIRLPAKAQSRRITRKPSFAANSLLSGSEHHFRGGSPQEHLVASRASYYEQG